MFLGNVFIQVHENRCFPRHLVQRRASAPETPSPDDIDNLLEGLVTQDNEEVRRLLANAVRTVLQAAETKRFHIPKP